MNFKTTIRIAILLIATILMPATTFGQKAMTPPHVMIVPDLIYCKAHGYVKTFNNNGEIEEVADYERALLEDPTLHGALTQIASLINERNGDIVIIDLQECINNAKKDAAISSANGGDESESIEEAIIRNSNADILVKLQYDLLKNGPQYSVNYTIRGTDAYTSNVFAPLEGVGAPSTSANPVLLLREAIYGSMDGFLDRMLRHYSSMNTKGRMVAFDIKTTSTSPVNMNSYMGDLTLREVIDDFLYDNSVDGGGLERVKGGDTFLQYEGVYIPLTGNIRGRVRRQGAKDVAQRLTNHLSGMGVTADFKIIGLGKVNIFIR